MRRGVTTALHTAAILLFLLALIGPRGRQIWMSLGLLVLITVQILLVGARDDTPWVAAFHPVLALFVLGLAFQLGMPALSRRGAASAPRPAR